MICLWITSFVMGTMLDWRWYSWFNVCSSTVSTESRPSANVKGHEAGETYISMWYVRWCQPNVIEHHVRGVRGTGQWFHMSCAAPIWSSFIIVSPHVTFLVLVFTYSKSYSLHIFVLHLPSSHYVVETPHLRMSCTSRSSCRF